MGRLAVWLASESVTATWQLSCLPSWPQYWRATPTECRPFLGKPVSSMIQASMGPVRSMTGRTKSRTLVSTAASDQGAWPTKSRSDWCWAATRAGAVTAAIGSTLGRHEQTRAVVAQGCGAVSVADDTDQRRNIGGKPHFTAVMGSHRRASCAGTGASFYSPTQASKHQPL